MGYKYFQPNDKDLKDQYGDCAIRCFCKCQNVDWLTAYDTMYRLSREVQCPFNFKQGFDHVFKSLGYTYHGISNKKGSKRPTVKSFSNDHKTGVYALVVANHYVASVDGDYFDTWNSGNKSLYGYWEKEV